MYNVGSFESTKSQEQVVDILGRYKYEEDTTIDELHRMVDEVQMALNVCDEAPKYRLNRTYYSISDDSDIVKSAQFTVKPSVSFALGVTDLKYTFVLFAGEDFYEKFIREMSQWFDKYIYYNKIEENLEEFNYDIKQVIDEFEIPFNLSFTVGTELVDTTEDSVVVGLSYHTIENLIGLPLYDHKGIEECVQNYKEVIADTLKQCIQPYDIVKVKSRFVKDLGIFSRKATFRLLKGVARRKIEFVRSGTGYYDGNGVFAVIDKQVVTEEELSQMDTANALVLDNKDGLKRDLDAGKTKMVISYRVKPIDKETGETVELNLEEHSKAG